MYEKHVSDYRQLIKPSKFFIYYGLINLFTGFYDFNHKLIIFEYLIKMP